MTRRFSSTPGTPERPLSELGERGYLAFWTSTLVRYFRTVLESRFDTTGGLIVLEQEEEDRSTGGKNKKIKRVASKAELHTISTATSIPKPAAEVVQPKVTTVALTPLVIAPPIASTSMIVTLSSSSSSTITPQVSTTPLGSPSSTTLTLRRSASGIASASFQPPSSPTTVAPSVTLVDIIPEVVPPVIGKGWARPEVQSLRLVLKPPSRAGSPSLIIKPSSTSSSSNLNNQIHLIQKPIVPVDPELFTRKFGLEEIALAVNLRVEDVAFALVESGLASWRRRERNNEEEDEKEEVKDGEGDIEMNGTAVVAEVPKIEVKAAAGGVTVEEKKILDEIVISRDLLEEVAEKYRVKDPLLDRSFVLI